MHLYALCDQDSLTARGISLEEFISTCKEKNAEIIQYRHKNGSIAEIKDSLITLRSLWDKFLIINDHYALASFCDGVHLGQEDLYAIDTNPKTAIKILKEVIGDEKLIGLSTHNADEITIANSLELNYIGLGAFRQTSTKDVSTILGNSLDTLAKVSKHYVAAIGGVKLNDTFKYVRYHVIGSGLYES